MAENFEISMEIVDDSASTEQGCHGFPLGLRETTADLSIFRQ